MSAANQFYSLFENVVNEVALLNQAPLMRQNPISPRLFAIRLTGTTLRLKCIDLCGGAFRCAVA